MVNQKSVMPVGTQRAASALFIFLGRCMQRPFYVSVLAQSPFPLFSFLFSLSTLLASGSSNSASHRSPLPAQHSLLYII